MHCNPITSLEEAERPIASAILPISGLRRDNNTMLTTDAVKTVMDSLRSRGIDLSEKEEITELLQKAAENLCILNEQYQFLLKRILDASYANEPIESKYVDLAIEKNQMLLDILTVSRHLEVLSSATSDFKEGFWQAGNLPFTKGVVDICGNTITVDGSGNIVPGTSVNKGGLKMLKESKLQVEQTLLRSKSYAELRKHAVEVTEEKNRAASHQLALYGFLNLVALGLLLYISMGR